MAKIWPDYEQNRKKSSIKSMDRICKGFNGSLSETRYHQKFDK